MLSSLFYLFLIALCTLFLLFSAVALCLTWPFDKPRRAVHELSRVLVRIFYGVPPLWRHRVEGLEHVERGKPYVIVLNHQAMIDIPTLYFVPLNFRWVSKREVFRIPFFGQFLLLHGDICIDRGRASAAMEQVIRDGRRWLSRGVSVAIFPEGTRSRDGEIHRFKAGAFTLAREAGAAILPVVLDGTREVIRPNLLFNWRSRLTVRVLPPVDAARVAAADPKEQMEQVRADMCAALAEIRNER
ncbi:MAG: 1-acyl-sn-glycerol-3-phosphate acyltransferase [Alistipes sp.]|nr:1-acyl-sn-glycerol-3-phosphate acyltransferase [Alistipes sp.]